VNGLAEPSPAGQERVAGDPLTATAAAVSERQAVELIAAHYGITGTATRLSGERDDNFRIDAHNGTRYQFKVVHPSEDPDVTDAQTGVLAHLQQVAPDLPVPRVLPDRHGRTDVRATAGPAAGRALRLTSFLTGELLKNVPVTKPLRRDLGATLAGLDRALADYTHPAVDKLQLLWDIAKASELRPLVAELEPAQRTVLEDLIDRFDTEIADRLAGQRAQVVHNDLSGDNVLIDPHTGAVTGLLDFGDMVHTALVNEVAVAAAYQLSDGPEPVGPALDLVAGYDAVLPLTDTEVDLLHDLIVTRMVTRIAITEWRAVRFPANRDYILRNTARTWAQLHRLLALSGPSATDDIRRALRRGEK
jgi:Ser/Thr protein kinase RdoA (MazF antagonist)